MSLTIGNRTAVIDVLNSLNQSSEKNDGFIDFNYSSELNKGRQKFSVPRTLLKSLISMKFNLSDSDIDYAINDLKSDGILKNVANKQDDEYLSYDSTASFTSAELDDLRSLFEDKSDIK